MTPNGNGAVQTPPPVAGPKAGDILPRGAPKVLHLVRPVPGPGGRATTRFVESDDGVRVQWRFVVMGAGPVPLPMLELTIVEAGGLGVAHVIPMSGVARIEVQVRRCIVDELAPPLIVPGRG